MPTPGRIHGRESGDGLAFDELELEKSYWTAPESLSEDVIIAFASQWDSEPMHLNREAAADSIFGGLIASGWHTLVLSFSMFQADGLMRGQVLAGVGIEDLRFRKAVRPNERLRVRYEVVQLRPTSCPGRGIVGLRIEVWNDGDHVVLDYLLKMLVRARRGI